jgi:hypothetical protein
MASAGICLPRLKRLSNLREGIAVRIKGAVAAGAVLAATMGSGVAVAAPELGVSDRLQDRRALVSGDRAYSVGFEDGRFYANGWHITGEMGGVWTPPIKLVDGVWFGVGDQWVGPATEFRSGWGYTRMKLPDTGGLKLERTDFAPDGGRAVLFGLKLSNPASAAKSVTVKVDSHSELLGAYPWGFAGVAPNASDNLADTAAFDGRSLVFREQGKLPHPNAEEHDWAAVVGSDRQPAGGETGPGHRGDQGDNVCTAEEPPSQCDDGPFGKGQGGQLRYDVHVKGHDSTTVWIAVAGSDKGLGAARDELATALKDPARALARKREAREKLASHTRVSLPGDRRLEAGIDWGKQNLADATQSARDLQIRYTDQGKQYPQPAGTVKSVRWFGAGWPDYPWIFATDGEYTAFAGVALGQFETAEDHMRALRDISEIANEGSGKVAHEIVPDGSIWFGANKDPGNTDETVKFPSIVALLWRWTGDDRFRDQMYDFATRNLHYVADNLDADGDGWPEGLGNVERTGMGPEKLDNTVYYIRGLYDLADLAQSKHDQETFDWAKGLADDLYARFEDEWWMQDQSLHADSLGTSNEKIQQKHWITSTPMETELTVDGRAVPGLASQGHGAASLALHQTACFSGERPFNRGLFHTGCGGGPDGNGELSIFSLNTAIQAVGEGNYGRLGAEQQKRYTDANVETQFGEPATGGTPDEQPGSMPEILPSPGFNPNIERCWTCRSMFMQAWGNYGTAWPVVHQQLGVRPDLGRDRLTVVPQLPSSAPIAGEDIRLGKGRLDLVRASRAGDRYMTTVDARHVPAKRLAIGQTLPLGSDVGRVTLDGRRTDYRARETNRGLEVTVRAAPGKHEVVVSAG